MAIKNNRIEFVPCNFCGIDHSEVLFNSGQLKISRCKKCGLIYTNPRLNQAALDALYNQTYFKSPTPLTLGYEDYIKDYKNITKTFKKRWAEIEKHLTGRSKVLDIGCACGFLLKFLKEKGIETYGVEISEFASRFAREKFGLNVISKPLREIKFPDNFFDVI
ncbi:MAG: methionine biosynthesis protein MetW, partial [candidate division WOR-3 bacterium]